MLLFAHAHPDGRIAGFWTDFDDFAYREDQDDIQALGEAIMADHEGEDFEDVVAELRDKWNEDGGWAVIEDFPDMTAAQALTEFFGE